jgi:Holliday junction DNA helicase RuvA
MIAHLRGTLSQAIPNEAIVDVGGVGYQVLIPLSTYDRLPAMGQEVKLLTHHHVTDRDHTLFGFLSSEERDLFRLLIDRVSGIGPKMALSVLSGMPPQQFQQAVINGDIALLGQIRGVGRKTAERIVLELKDKVGVTQAWQAATQARQSDDPRQQAASDAVLALIALGYKQAEAQKAVQALIKEGKVGNDANAAQQLLREALRQLQ